MSYILDALRRADAERERGVVPGLQSQQHAIAEDDATPPARSRALLWAVGGLSAALVAVLAWNLFGGGRAPATRPIEGSVAPATAPATPPPLLPTTPPAPTAAAPPAVAAPAAPPAPPPATPGAAPTAAVAPPMAEHAPKHAAATPRPARQTTEPRRAPHRNDEGSAAPAAPPAAQGSAEGRVYRESELPDDIRRDLPRLSIGGASYSGDAASRMVMINGQVFHEGDRLAPGLVLDRIKLKSAVLSYKGYRYEVTF